MHNFVSDDESLLIHWSDGHQSSYSLSWLLSMFYEPSQKFKPRFRYWNAANWASGLPKVTYSEVKQGSGLGKLLMKLIVHGFAFVEGVPVSYEETQVKSFKYCSFFAENPQLSVI